VFVFDGVLDVDGVLNDGYRGHAFLLEDRLLHLKEIVNQTKCRIVLSSNWRLFADYRDALLPKLREHGIIDDELLGMTPDLDLDHLPMRPREILQWIRDSTSVCPWSKSSQTLPTVCQFVVLDDRNLVSEPYGHSLHGRFVQTNGQIGLTKEIAERVVKVFSQQPKITCLSTWALNHWKIFDEFDNTTYEPVGPYAIRIVDTRSAPGPATFPLHFMKTQILYNILSYLPLDQLFVMASFLVSGTSSPAPLPFGKLGVRV